MVGCSSAAKSTETARAPTRELQMLAASRARASGSSVILPRHLAEAALALRRPDASTHSSPSAVLPTHFDELCAELAAIHDAVTLDAAEVRQVGTRGGSQRTIFFEGEGLRQVNPPPPPGGVPAPPPHHTHGQNIVLFLCMTALRARSR